MSRKQLSFGPISVQDHTDIMVPLEETVLDLKKHGYPNIKKKMLATNGFKVTAQFLNCWLNTVLSAKEAKAVAEKEVFRERLTDYLLTEAAKKAWLDLARKLADEITEECYGP